MHSVSVTKATDNTVVGDAVEVADTSFTRLFGLLGKHNLDTGKGLWIKPSSGVHTMGMKFTIDVIGLDKELRVVRLWSNLVPFRVTSVSTKVRSVIELPAGQIEACAVKLGDRLRIG